MKHQIVRQREKTSLENHYSNNYTNVYNNIFIPKVFQFQFYS